MIDPLTIPSLIHLPGEWPHWLGLPPGDIASWRRGIALPLEDRDSRRLIGWGRGIWALLLLALLLPALAGPARAQTPRSEFDGSDASAVRYKQRTGEWPTSYGICHRKGKPDSVLSSADLCMDGTVEDVAKLPEWAATTRVYACPESGVSPYIVLQHYPCNGDPVLRANRSRIEPKGFVAKTCSDFRRALAELGQTCADGQILWAWPWMRP